VTGAVAAIVLIAVLARSFRPRATDAAPAAPSLESSPPSSEPPAGY
jgi:hypothetical protein